MYILVDFEWGVVVNIFDSAGFDYNILKEGGVVYSIEYYSLPFKKV